MSDERIPSAPAPRPAIPVTRPTSNGDTVTVACKHPQGIILRVFDMVDYEEATRDGGTRKGKKAIPIPELQFVVRGPWVGSAGQAYHKNNPAVVELLPGGYALTLGCPKEVWDRWYEQNKTHPLVINKIIFAHANHSTVQQESIGMRQVQSGLEPIDPAKPAERMPGGVDRRLRAVGRFEQGEGSTSR